MGTKKTRSSELLALGMFGGGSRLGDLIEALLERGHSSRREHRESAWPWLPLSSPDASSAGR